MNFKIFFASLLTLALCASLPAEENFEAIPNGKFTELKCSDGTWHAEENQAEILSGQGYKSEKALRILGGKNSAVTLKLSDPFEKAGMLSFQAKRWTQTKPFAFRIEAQTTSWIPIYNNDKIPMDYSDPIQVKLPPGTRAVQFIANTPAERPAGILLDNIGVELLGPMILERVESVQEMIPMLVGQPKNTVLRLDFKVKGAENPIRVKEIRLTTHGTTRLDDIASFDAELKNGTQTLLFGTVKPAKTMTIKGNLALETGSNAFSIYCKLKPNADIDGIIDVQCTEIILADGEKIIPEIRLDQPGLRMGFRLRTPGQDHSKSYRIPGLAATPKGTLIAVYDNRYNGSGDLQGDIDIGMSRSTNGGKTWEPMKVVMDMGEYGGHPQRLNGCTDPSVLVDAKTGTIWVAALWISGVPGHTWFSSKPGMEPNVTGQFILVQSDDDGLTWSKPINITPQIKNPEWDLFFQGPGAGITMRDGTLVFPAQYKLKGIPHSTIISSKDRGKTWKVGTGAKSKTTEAQVVELDDGTLMLNMRDDRGGSRSVAVTADLGQTWTEHPSSRLALPEPVCQGSILCWSSVKTGAPQTIFLFSNPNVSRAPRRMMTLKGSLDNGISWPEKYHLLYDARDCFGYSCLAPADRDHVGVLYEGQNDLNFIRIPVADILKENIEK